ncbi:hypothetical protein [Nitrospira sp. Nam80]
MSGDFNWPTAPDPDPLPPGKYIAGYLRSDLVERFPGRRTIDVVFKIIEPLDQAGKRVKRYYSVPMDEPPGLDSDYYKDWKLANDGIAPKRNDRMSPQVFKGYWFIEVGLTKQRAVRDRDKGGVRALQDGEVGRPVVKSLLERIAGAAGTSKGPEVAALTRTDVKNEKTRTEKKR